MIRLHERRLKRLGLFITYLFACPEYLSCVLISAPNSSFINACSGVRPPPHQIPLVHYLHYPRPSPAIEGALLTPKPWSFGESK